MHSKINLLMRWNEKVCFENKNIYIFTKHYYLLMQISKNMLFWVLSASPSVPYCTILWFQVGVKNKIWYFLCSICYSKEWSFLDFFILYHVPYWFLWIIVWTIFSLIFFFTKNNNALVLIKKNCLYFGW
jgi:hypothetical protein